jgi:hypothetical protein
METCAPRAFDGNPEKDSDILDLIRCAPCGPSVDPARSGTTIDIPDAT